MPRHALWITLTAHPGRRDELAACTLELALRLQHDPRCELFVVGTSATDGDVLRLCEIFTSPEAARAVLEEEDIRLLVARATPLIAARVADVGAPLDVASA